MSGYIPGTNEIALGAGATASEGYENRSIIHEGTDSTVSVHTSTQTPQQIPAHEFTIDMVLGVLGLDVGFPTPGPIKLNVISSKGEHFHLTTAESVPAIMSFATRHAGRCAGVLGNVEFEPAPNGLIARYADGEELRYSYECPEPEPAREIDLGGYLVELADATIGDACTVNFYRFFSDDGTDTEDQVAFDVPATSIDSPWIRPDQIPELIDALTEMHRQWLHLVADEECGR